MRVDLCLRIPSWEGWRTAPGWVLPDEHPPRSLRLLPLPRGESIVRCLEHPLPVRSLETGPFDDSGSAANDYGFSGQGKLFGIAQHFWSDLLSVGNKEYLERGSGS